MRRLLLLFFAAFLLVGCEELDSFEENQDSTEQEEGGNTEEDKDDESQEGGDQGGDGEDGEDENKDEEEGEYEEPFDYEGYYFAPYDASLSSEDNLSYYVWIDNPVHYEMDWYLRGTVERTSRGDMLRPGYVGNNARWSGDVYMYAYAPAHTPNLAIDSIAYLIGMGARTAYYTASVEDPSSEFLAAAILDYMVSEGHQLPEFKHMLAKMKFSVTLDESIKAAGDLSSGYTIEFTPDCGTGRFYFDSRGFSELSRSSNGKPAYSTTMGAVKAGSTSSDCFEVNIIPQDLSSATISIKDVNFANAEGGIPANTDFGPYYIGSGELAIEVEPGYEYNVNITIDSTGIVDVSATASEMDKL